VPVRLWAVLLAPTLGIAGQTNPPKREKCSRGLYCPRASEGCAARGKDIPAAGSGDRRRARVMDAPVISRSRAGTRTCRERNGVRMTITLEGNKEGAEGEFLGRPLARFFTSFHFFDAPRPQRSSTSSLARNSQLARTLQVLSAERRDDRRVMWQNNMQRNNMGECTHMQGRTCARIRACRRSGAKCTRKS